MPANHSITNVLSPNLCIWYVDKAWKRRLPTVQKIHKQQIYSYIYCMLHTKSEQEFKTFSNNLFEKYSSMEPIFCKYLQDNYMNRIEKWAIYKREKDLQTVITTNMFIESFHNKLKTQYFDRKQNKRVDRLLYTLLEMEKDYYLSHLKKSCIQ